MTTALTEPFESFLFWAPISPASWTFPAGRNGNCAQTASATNTAFRITPTLESATLTMGVAYQVSSLASAHECVVLLSDTNATAHLTLSVNTDGSLTARRGTISGTVLGTTATGLIAINTWYYVELQSVLSDTVGTVLLAINGTTALNLTAQDTKNAGTKTVYDSVRLYGASSITSKFDDGYIATGGGETFRGSQTLSALGADALARYSTRVLFSAALVGSGAITFAGSGTATTVSGSAGTGSGAITFAGSGTATSSPAGTGAITFAGSGVAASSIGGVGAIGFAGSGTAFTPARGDIFFDGYGVLDVIPHLDIGVPPEWSWYLLTSSGASLSALTTATARKLTFPLDGPATASFTMPGEHAETAAVVELATDVYVARNGRPLFRGRVGASSETHSAAADGVNLTATDYRGLLDHRIFWPESTLSFTGADQSDIAWKAIADAQALTGGNLGISRGIGAVTGVARDRAYTAGTSIGQSIHDLGNVTGGFDWEIDPHLVFNLYHPERGRNTGLVLTYGKEIVASTSTVNPAAYANAIYYTGSTPTTAPVEAVGTAPAGVGRWDLQKSDPNIVLQATVAQQAAGELTNDSQLLPAFAVTLAADTWNPYTLWLGDKVRLIVQVGRLNIDVTRRVIQIDVTLDDDGVESVTLAVGAAAPRLSDRLTTIAKEIAQLQLAPGIGTGYGGGGGGGGGAGIQEITSSDGSIVVTNAFGPVTDLKLAGGGLITVTNPTGPIVDLTLGGLVYPETVRISYPSQLLTYWNRAPADWNYWWTFSFAGAGGLFLVTEPPPGGDNVNYPNGVSRLTNAGTYQMSATFTVDSPLTPANPFLVAGTTLDFNPSIGTGGGRLEPFYHSIYEYVGDPVTFNVDQLNAYQPTAAFTLITSALAIGGPTISDHLYITVDMSITFTPPPP